MHAWRIAGAVAAKIFRMFACLVAAYLIYAMAFLIPGGPASDGVMERVGATAALWLLLAACSVGLSYLLRMKDGVKRSFWKTGPFVFFALFTACVAIWFIHVWVL
jgi:hypothetical protein